MSTSHWRLSRRAVATTTVAAVVGGFLALPNAASAASVTSAVFSGGGGTASVGGTLYAKQGAALTLKVSTSDDTRCVAVTGAATLPRQTSGTPKSSWEFTTTAPGGNGVQGFTVAASPNSNSNGCTGQTNSTQASYTLDNTGPLVSAALTPSPNAAGWNTSDVTVKWTATDAGAGVTGTQPFKTDTVTANGIVTLGAPALPDRLGNVGGPGSVTVRVDKANPSITAAQVKNADGTTTITFTCSDSNSGGGEASGIATCLADGSTTNSRTVQPGVTVTGTATDKAGNIATTTSTAPAGDTTPPQLSGAPTTQPNGNGWYRGDVTVRWTASDPESGVATAPADTAITGEGEGLTSNQTVKNGAGLSTTATSSPAVNIDRTAPTTAISGTSNGWVNGTVTLSLSATDNLSGVASTSYSVNGGPVQSASSISLASEGEHSVTFFSTDKAGNAEAAQTATIKIDTTAPTIAHTFAPLSYQDGAWTNQDVTVTFACADQGGSGLAGCTTPVTTSTEGEGQQVVGTASDEAGNSATDTAVVSIDKTAPTVSAAASGTRNAAGWYDKDVTVSFSASDALSGVAAKSADMVLGEGANQSASGTATDAAGNTASAGVTGINVDKTPPVLTASFERGWHTDDVAVTWSCTDALSGVATGPENDTVSGEGASLSSTASCTDNAGNTVTTSVNGIQIDRNAPTTQAKVPSLPDSGWYTSDVEVKLDASDNLSGVGATYYAVDGGAKQAYTAPFFLAEGEHTVSFWSVDGAGNVEEAGAPLSVKVDKTAPTTKVINPISPDSGWFVTSGIPVAFEATDSGSGIAATYYAIDGGDRLTYGEPFTADLSTGIHKIEYWSVDTAGNAEAKGSTNTIEVKVDTIVPTIKGAQTPAANSFGWNNTDVEVTFTCTDADSGIDGVAGCAGDTTLANDGAEQTVAGDAVDVAGNRSSTVFGPVSIDKTKPTLVGVPTDQNGAGWHKGDVEVKWVGDDPLSGIDPATQPTASTISGEGSNLGAGPVTIKDKAGNTSEPASVTGIKIDRTAPVVAGAPTTSPNAAGWYNGAVTVDFTCEDGLSGVASCPTSKVLRGDGANQSVTSDPATDVAGNASAGKTVGGINIDSTAPATSSDNQCTKTNGWCTGSTANVVLTAADQAGLSGVKELRYSLNGGAEQVAAGASKTVSVPLDGSGNATVRYYAVDNAGNVETTNTVALKYDNIAPAVTHTLTPKPNADDWNNTDVTVHFDAKDDDAGSGVDAGSVTKDVVVSTETAGLKVEGSAKDLAGNLGTDSATVKLDKTKPTITAEVTSGTKGNNGWYVGSVTVKFTCMDALSGVATCPDPVTLTANGANTATGTVTDMAGNTAAVTVSGIQIDQEKPTLTTADVTVQGGTYTLGSVPAATCTATDSFSGFDSCKVTATGGNANGVGAFTYTATATDKAGNVSTVSGTYRVVYRFDGFLQPINDTAHHQVGTSTSIFKAGSTVPAKIQLKTADGSVVQATTAPAWVTPAKGSATSAAVDELSYSAPADSGSAYRYDATSRQYIYNWKTGSAAGNYWRVGVKLDDGQAYYVNIGLR